jgi:hypothetical protein
MASRPPRPFQATAALAAAVALCLPRPSARADGSVGYIFENYREEDNRITVETQSGSADQDVGAFGHLSLTGTIDAVSGATPTGQPAPEGSDQVVLTQIHTRRKAWSGNYAQQLGNVNIEAGFADSRENDYVSAGWSVSTLADSNQKNTTVRLGAAGTDDRVEVFFTPQQTYLPKRTNDAILGVTQLIDPLTVATLNVSWGRATGYLSEPHKFVSKSIQIIPNIFLLEDFGENSPGERNKGSIYASLNRAFPAAHGALEASYRFYSDTWGVVANTAEVDWFQHLGGKVILSPSLRLYQQGAANFYYYNLDDTTIIPVHQPTGSGPNYSSDFRLSAMRSFEYGLRLTWSESDRLQFEMAYKRYEIRGTDGVTPASAYPTAGIATLGARFLW